MKFLKIVGIFLIIGAIISFWVSSNAQRNNPTLSPSDNSSSAPAPEIKFSIIKGITTVEGREIWTVLVDNFENNSSSFSKIKYYGRELAISRWENNKKATAVAVYFFDNKNNVIAPEKVEKYWDTTDELPHCIACIDTAKNEVVVATKYPFVDSLGGNY